MTFQPREDVAALLRAGATYRAIHQQLGVSHGLISKTRTFYKIPVPRRIGPRGAELRAATERRYPQVVAMLRAGATHRQITAATGATTPTITRVRRILDIPVPVGHMRTARTIAQGLALYVEPYGDDHARWTGPRADDSPQLWASGRRYNARHETFRAHHGRPPVGSVRASCTERRCIAGAHLTDQTIRDEVHLDALYQDIFGDTA
ncbi:Trp family transcriptional regulator [Streptomyces sp. NPDC004069]